MLKIGASGLLDQRRGRSLLGLSKGISSILTLLSRDETYPRGKTYGVQDSVRSWEEPNNDLPPSVSGKCRLDIPARPVPPAPPASGGRSRGRQFPGARDNLFQTDRVTSVACLGLLSSQISKLEFPSVRMAPLPPFHVIGSKSRTKSYAGKSAKPRT